MEKQDYLAAFEAQIKDRNYMKYVPLAVARAIATDVMESNSGDVDNILDHIKSNKYMSQLKDGVARLIVKDAVLTAKNLQRDTRRSGKASPNT